MRLLPTLVLALTCLLGPAEAVARPVTIFAAASLTDALQEIGTTYYERTGNPVQFSFASSSTLARQIEAGAPADVVALANLAWADYLDDRALTLAGSRIEPIGNRLVLAGRPGLAATFSDPPTAAEIVAALGPAGRIAMGDPAHVPAGIYAKQSLESLGVWHEVSAHVAYADNVRSALALVAHGDAPLGIVYASDTRAVPGIEVPVLLPEASHAPIAYAFAAVTGGNVSRAMDFLDYLAGSEALATFARYGFTVR